MKNLTLFLAITLSATAFSQSLIGTWNITNTKVNNSNYGTPYSALKVHFNSSNFEVQFCDGSVTMYANCVITPNSIDPAPVSGNYFGCGTPAQDEANGVVAVIFGCEMVQQSQLITTTYNATNNTYVLTRNCGTLTYALTLSQGTSGIEDNYFNDNEVYPNPTTGVINVKRFPVDLFDQYGQKIATINSDQFDLTNYPKGVYFVGNKKIVNL